MTPIDRADLERGRATEPLVRVSALHHLVLETPDLDPAERFYRDFGLSPAARTSSAVYLRGLGPAAYALELRQGPRSRLASVAMRVDAELDLRKLASLPGASPVEPTGEPGGGLRVSVPAPGGIVFDAVHGIEEVAPVAPRAAIPFNVGGPPARAGATVRVPPSPSEVLCIGHAALETTEPVALVLWLLRTLGMIVSDYQPLEDGPRDQPIVTFLRCDRGLTPTDHHTLAIALGPHVGLSHAAFEVRDLDEISRGGEWLRGRGYSHAWGIGRHILGSQIFDYWRAPDGVVVEHYADGDVFDATAPTGRLAFSGSSLAQWGPKPPLAFALPPFSLGGTARAARALAASNELSVPLLMRAARALSR